MKKRAIAYWLVPSGNERELFREVIRILCEEFDAPVFKPHLTIFATTENRSPKKVLQQIHSGPIRLRAGAVAFSSQFTKTLFVRLKSTTALKKLLADLSRLTKSRGRPVRDLHLSLLYKKLPGSIKKGLSSTLRLPFRDVVFDSIEAVRCVSPTKTRADVEGWRVVARKSLTG